MNREQFNQRVAAALEEEAWLGHDLPLSEQARSIADALWPVLAQVWASGYIAGANDQTNGDIGTEALAPNPYHEPIDTTRRQ